MDTKLKKASFSTIIKAIVSLFAIICLCISVTLFVNLMNNTNGLEPLSKSSFLNTNELLEYEHNFYIGLESLLKYKSEDYIKQGNTIDKKELENRKKELFREWYNEVNLQTTQGSYESYESDEYIPDQKLNALYLLLKERFETENAEKIKKLYDSMIESELKGYYSLMQRVNNKQGLHYYATNGENTYTNCNQADPAYFKGFKAYYLADRDGIKIFPNAHSDAQHHYTKYIYNENDYSINDKVYIAATDEYIMKNQAIMDNERTYLQNIIIIIACLVLTALIAVICLIYKAGRKDNDDNIHLMAIDKLYTDINIAVIIGISALWAVAFVGLMGEGFLNYIIVDLSSIKLDFFLTTLLNIVYGGIALTLFLSLIRHLKNRTFIKHSLVYIVFVKLRDITKNIFLKLKDAVKAIINAGPLSVRIAVIIAACEICVMILTFIVIKTNDVFSLFWFIVLAALSVLGIYFVILKIKPISDIAKGVEEIKNGRLEHVIAVEGNGDLKRLANDINDITDGLKNAVAKEIKAEKMKSELVTNVSHDLKTPLTSIINYVELLSKEKLTPDEANDYVAVLKQKSEKLRILTQDLFEISKAQSGNISVDIEKIDITVLIRQSLAEFEEQITASGLDFKVKIQENNNFIMADGKRLSRVFENLIGNILKYTLPKTRVYIDVFSNENNVYIEFKNIANYEMNFKEDEILERFVRGDESRTTDGNGLGLAIAESYVNACGGSLKISIDGDLFKASIKFTKA